MLKRTTYNFTHPKAESPIVIKAWSIDGAWKKMRKTVIRMMYGDWAMRYDYVAVEKVMSTITVEVVK